MIAAVFLFSIILAKNESPKVENHFAEVVSVENSGDGAGRSGNVDFRPLVLAPPGPPDPSITEAIPAEGADSIADRLADVQFLPEAMNEPGRAAGASPNDDLTPSLRSNFRRLNVSGWTDMSFTGSTARYSQSPMGMNYLANQFLLQQNWLRIEMPVETDTGAPSFGFRSDTILPGSDYVYTQARGLFDNVFDDGSGKPSRYGIDPVQFWAEGYFPSFGQGLSLKLGRFFAPFGVESIAAAESPLPSRAYCFIYDPFTQTGLLGNLKMSDRWSVKSGIIIGNDIFINAASTPYFVGGFRFDPGEGRTTADFTMIFGNGEYDQTHEFNNPQVFDLVLTRRFSDSVTWNLDVLYGYQNRVPEIGFANWLAFVNYLTVNWTGKLASTARLEFFDDFQGQRTGHTGLYTAITAGASYKMWSWLWIRPELRFDYNPSGPFEGKPALFTATLDVIVRW